MEPMHRLRFVLWQQRIRIRIWMWSQTIQVWRKRYRKMIIKRWLEMTVGMILPIMKSDRLFHINTSPEFRTSMGTTPITMHGMTVWMKHWHFMRILSQLQFMKHPVHSQSIILWEKMNFKCPQIWEMMRHFEWQSMIWKRS